MGQCTLGGTEGNRCNSCWWPRPSSFCLVPLGAAAPHHSKDMKSFGSRGATNPQDHPDDIGAGASLPAGDPGEAVPYSRCSRGWKGLGAARRGERGQSPAPAACRRLRGGAGAPRGGNEEASAGHFSMLSQSNICLVNKYIVVFFSARK